MSTQSIPLLQEPLSTTCSLCGINCRIVIDTNKNGHYRISGDKRDTVTGGALCKKGRESIELMLHPNRLQQPLKRTGKRGGGKWQPISWEEAFQYTAERFSDIQEQWGKNSLFMAYGYSKDFMYTQLLRLANRLKTANIAGPETVCWAPTKLGCDYTLGFNPSHDLNEQTRCIILWGVNKYKTRFTDLSPIKTAMTAGAKTICIDPQFTRHAKEASHWLAINPGADLALALALLKIIIEEHLYDQDFVNHWCQGFEALKTELSQYDLTYLANQCQLDIERIKTSARLYASSKPAVIITGNALDHNSDSFQVNRAIAMLMAITGNIDIPGGQFQPHGDSLVSGRWPYDDQDVDELSEKDRLQSAGTPVLPEYFRATSQGLTKAMLTGKPYPVKAGLIVGSNPMTSWPDTKTVYQALSQLDFLAVSELFMTPTAMMADIVFPAASFLEFEGITQGQDGSIRFQKKVMQVGDCKPDHEIISGIGVCMNVMPPQNEETFWNGFLQKSGIDYSTLKAREIIPPPSSTRRFRKYRQEGFPTESGKIELYSKKLSLLGASPLPVYRNLQPNNPDYPLRLTTNKPKNYMFSHGRQLTNLRKTHPAPLVRLHPKTADRLNLTEGSEVAIETPGNKVIYQTLKLDSQLDPEVAIADLSWWFPESGEARLGDVFRSNFNVLTSLESGPHGDGEAGSFNTNGIPCRLRKMEQAEQVTTV